MMFCCVLLMLVKGTAFAEEWENFFTSGIGLETYYHEYKEPGIMKNDGLFYGLTYYLAYEKEALIRLEGLVSYGQVDYSSTSTGESDDIDDFCVDTRVVVGHTVYDDKRAKVTPFIGFGYRFLQDDSESRLTTTGNIGYLRESNYYYSPIGLKILVRYDNGWSLAPEVEYDYFWSGEQESELGYLPGYEDVKNDQEDGYGYRASLTLSKDRGHGMGCSFKIFYRYWDIDDSEVTVDRFSNSWIEPKNETVEYGLNISLSF